MLGVVICTSMSAWGCCILYDQYQINYGKGAKDKVP